MVYDKNVKVIKSGRFIKSGAGAAYDIIIKDIELDKSGYKIVSDEVTNEEYNEHLAIVEVPVKPCVVTEWSAESYYDGISSDHEMFDSEEDSKIEGGKATLKVWWTEHEEGRYIDNNEFENVNEAVEFYIPSDISIKVKFGAGWFHADLPVENVHLEDDSGEIDLYNDGYGYSIISVDLICPNICQDINAFFKNPEEYYTESYNVYSSKKFIKSAENYGWVVDSSDAMKALNMWSEYVGEDNALEDIAKAMSDDTLNENIEWVAQQWGFGEELEELNTAWEKYEFAKEVMGVHDLFENLTQAAGYDELAEDLAFIFRQYDFRQWDEENEDDIYSSKKKAKTADERAKDEGADITCSRKVIKSSSVRCITFEQIVDSRFDDISKGEKILNDRKNEIIELCGDDFSVYTNKIKFLDWGDDESQYRQRYYIRKNNNNVSWNDLYKIVNSVKAVPYKFDKINDSVFESRKPIKSSEDSINGLSPRQYRNAIDKASEMIANGERDVQKICKATKLDEGDINAMIADQEEFEESLNSSRKAIKSGWTFKGAVDTFKSEYGRFNDYWEMQQAWEVFKDGLARDGEITQKQFDSWGNPCTPESFNRWNGPAPEDEFEEDIYSSRKIIKSAVGPGDTVYFWLSDDAREKYFNTDELGNPAGDWEEGDRIMEILDDNFQQVWKEEVSSPEDGPSPNDLIPSGIYETTPRELKDFFDKGLLDKSVIEVGLGYEETEGDYGEPWYKIKDVVDIDSIINFED